MARQLQALIATLELTPAAFRLRSGQRVGLLPRSDSSAIAWDLAGAWSRLGDSPDGATWEGTAGDRWAACARLRPGSAGYETDDGYDVAGNGPRTAQTPPLEAAGLRAWYGLELLYLAPEGTEIRIRLLDTETERQLWWDGAAWSEAVPVSTVGWNTPAEAVAAFASLPGSVRGLAVVAWLSTTEAGETPHFYGARVAYGVRQISGLDDALFRTLLASLRAEIEVTGIAEWVTDDETAAVTLAGPDGLGPGELAYEVTSLLAAFDLTADPDELEELPGLLVDGVWTPTTPIPAGHVIRVEFGYRPDLVGRRHVDLTELARLPAVYLGAGGGGSTVFQSGDVVQVRNVHADPPTAIEVPAPDHVTIPLEVRIVSELGADVQRISEALSGWLATLPDGTRAGPGQARVLVSPETGQVVGVRQRAPAVETPAALAQGVAEARASWLLSCSRSPARSPTTATLVRQDGITVTASEA